MINQQAVSIELHHEISRFLYREARMLDNERVREWLTEIVAPDISYQMVITEERFRKDKSPQQAREVLVYDENMEALELRLKQFETGLQTMLDPPQRMQRVITNIEAFHQESKDEYLVLSYGIVSRFRRQYESEQLVFSRQDVLRRIDDQLCLARRRIDIPERVIRNKNLLFFL